MRSYRKRVSIENLSGNEVYYTAWSLLVILKHLCSKIHYQKRFKLKPFFFKIMVQGSGFRVQGSGFMVQGSGCRVQGSGFRVQGPGFRVQGSGFRV